MTDGLPLLEPERLWTASEVLARPSPVPANGGVYAWYFNEVPSAVPTAGTHRVDACTLLYVGIAPKAPPANGKPASRSTLRKRIRKHYRLNAAGSTLRLTLGCLLQAELGIELRRVGSGERLTFTKFGEAKLSQWMDEHARACWITTDAPWELEHELIHQLALPLNLDQNQRSGFHAELSMLRRDAKARARELPIVI